MLNLEVAPVGCGMQIAIGDLSRRIVADVLVQPLGDEVVQLPGFVRRLANSGEARVLISSSLDPPRVQLWHDFLQNFGHYYYEQRYTQDYPQILCRQRHCPENGLHKRNVDYSQKSQS
jgi:hypothetical protein